MKLIKFHDLRLKSDFWINPEFVFSVQGKGWPETKAKACIEFKGQQLYGNHTIYVTESCEEAVYRLTRAVSSMRLVVDGIDEESGFFAGDGTLPPFVVFDVGAQEIIAGPYKTRDRAEAERRVILRGVTPMLNNANLAAALESIDNCLKQTNKCVTNQN